MKIPILALLSLLLFLNSATPTTASSVQIPSLWTFIDYNMPLSQYDNDPSSNQYAITERIKCILRIPAHLINFNYRSTDVYTGVRVSIQILSDVLNVLPDKRDTVGDVWVIAYQTALNQARANGDLEVFSNGPLLGLNTFSMKTWISSNVFTVVAADSNDFSTCPSNIDYSEVVKNTFTTLLNDTTIDYYNLGNVVTTDATSNYQTSTNAAADRSLILVTANEGGILSVMICLMVSLGVYFF